LGPEGIVDWAVIGDVLGTRFGRMWLARLGLLGLLAPLLVVEGRRLAEGRSPRNGAMVALGLGGVAMLATTTLSGHATSGRLVGVAIPTDIVHLTAVSAWLGGLVFLAAGALRSTSDVEGLERLVPRFSRLAFAAVVVIVVSGTLQSWRQLETIDALTGTTYGRLLLTKLAIVGGVLLLAAVSRSWVRRRYGAMAMATANPTGLRVSHNPGHVAHDNPGGAADDNPGGEAHDHPGGRSEQLDADKAPESGHRAGTLSQLRRSVAGEVALAIAVLAVASLLVNAIPGGQALALPYTIEVPMGEDLQADVVVDPATAGPLDVHVYALSPAGMPTPVDDVTVDLRLPERDVGPLRVPLERAGPNHFVAYDFDVPIEGEWEFDVGVRIGEFDAFNEQANVPIR
jgi:copper transport protein